jgi:hypothetical protein
VRDRGEERETGNRDREEKELKGREKSRRKEEEWMTEEEGEERGQGKGGEDRRKRGREAY